MVFWEKLRMRLPHAAHGHYEGIGYWKWSYFSRYEMAVSAIECNEIRGKCEIGKSVANEARLSRKFLTFFIIFFM